MKKTIEKVWPILALTVSSLVTALITKKQTEDTVKDILAIERAQLLEAHDQEVQEEDPE